MARTSELTSGQPKVVKVAGHTLAVGRVGTRFFAVDNTCPHAGGSLGAGSLDAQWLICPIHAWEFDVFTGECARMGEKIATYCVRVQNGVLEVRI